MIELGYPWALLALVSLPALIVLHSLRPTRRTVVISSNALWREALRHRKQGLGLRKLLRELSLVLLLLFALLVSLALSGPRWWTASVERNDVVVILDASASMRAVDREGERFAAAKREVARLIERLPQGARMLLMTSGARPVLRSGFERSRPVLRRALAALQPTDEAGRPRPAVSLALSLLRTREAGRIYFVTDGAFRERLDLGTSAVELVRVGKGGRNLAITRFDFRAELGTADRFQALLTVRNYTAEALQVPATVEIGEAQLLRRTLILAPHAKQTIVVPVTARASGRAVARIEVDDDLSADNVAYAVVSDDPTLRVLLYSSGNFYLESVFEALPNVSVSKLDFFSADRFGELAAEHDLVVFDRLPPPRLSAGSYLLIDTLPPGLPFRLDGWVERPVIVGRGDSALVRNLDLTGVKIDRARRVVLGAARPGLQRLFWSAQSDLALAYLRDDLRLVYLGFDIAESSLPLHTAFPLFLAESLTWLRPRASRFAPTQIAAGEPYSLPRARFPPGQSTVTVRTPGGGALEHPLGTGSFVFDQTGASGIYAVSVGGQTQSFAVNLTDEGESDIEPRTPRAARSGGEPGSQAGQAEAQVAVQTSQARRTHADPSGQTGRSAHALWPYLAFAALVLLVLERGLGWSGRRHA